MKSITSQFEMVPLEQIVDGESFRHSTDEDSITKLTESMKVSGLLQPVAVTLIDGGRYRIVFGHRRVAAARYLDWKKIEVIILEGENLDALGILENVQRVDLTPAELGLAMKQLVDSGNWKQVELAGMLGKSKIEISRLVKLGDLVREYGDRVSFTKLPVSTYWELLDTPELLILAEDGKWNQQRARKEAKQYKKLKEVAEPSGPSSNQLTLIEKPSSKKYHLKNQNFDTYEPITFFDGGFEIHPFRYARDLSLDIESVCEKITELQNRLDHVIEILRHYQGQRNERGRDFDFETAATVMETLDEE